MVTRLRADINKEVVQHGAKTLRGSAPDLFNELIDAIEQNTHGAVNCRMAAAVCSLATVERSSNWTVLCVSGVADAPPRGVKSVPTAPAKSPFPILFIIVSICSSV